MLALLLARIEIQLETSNDSSSPGTLAPWMVMAALFVLVAGLAGSLGRRRRERLPSALDSQLQPASSEDARRRNRPQSVNSILHAKERRRHPRRGGSHVKILVAFGGSPEPPVHGVVLDRSRGGLLIALPRPAEVGSFLDVQLPQGPQDLAPVRVEVRHCRQKDDRWLAGCKFEQALPLGTLFLFG